MTQRRPLIAANWKLNGSCELAAQSFQALSNLPATNTEILICPPVIFLTNFPKSDRYKLGAQNVSSEVSGAFTGEISADMLADAGASYLIVGHSERRALFGETDALVLAKTKRAIAAKITPIVCFGETLTERKQEKTMQVLAQHLDAVYAPHPELLQHSVIAYEPIWAIGTGETASPEQAQEVHAFIRSHLKKYDSDAASKVRIIYGGSVNAQNCAALFAQPDIDGGLVGGASLKPAEFADICLSAQE
jgi:triosephosphate isomerase (TIM)